ncbi:MAG: glutathione S-transferase N-terminal domain-containing protein [Acidiferrobacterales bacterium]
MKLYGSSTSPYVRKVRISLREKSIACDFVVSDPWDEASMVPKLNLLGKVPVLELDDGSTLFDSPVIIEYLDSLKGENLLPAAGEIRWQALRWQALGDGILDAAVARLLETRRPEELQSSTTISHQESKVARALEFIDKTNKGKHYFVDDRFTLADLTIGVALEYVDFRYPHNWREQFPRIALKLVGLSTRPSFAETLPPGMERAVDAPH